jgi:hypothetical protein
MSDVLFHIERTEGILNIFVKFDLRKVLKNTNLQTYYLIFIETEIQGKGVAYFQIYYLRELLSF